MSPKEIRTYYENHPDKMSKEGLDFIDRNFNKEGADVDLEGEFSFSMNVSERVIIIFQATEN